MPSLDGPNGDGTGYVKDAAGEEMLCPRCGGTGVLFLDEDDPDTE